MHHLSKTGLPNKASSMREINTAKNTTRSSSVHTQIRMHSSLPFSFILFFFYKFLGAKTEAIRKWLYDWPLGQTDRDDTITHCSSYAASRPSCHKPIRGKLQQSPLCIYILRMYLLASRYSFNLYSNRRVATFDFLAIIILCNQLIQLKRQLTRDIFTTFFYSQTTAKLQIT